MTYKNNSGGGVTSKLSDLVAMQSNTKVNVFNKNLATDFPVAKTLIKYNSNGSEEMKKRRSQFILSLLSKTLILKMMKMLLNLNDRVHKKAMKILLWLTSLRITKAN